MGPSSTMPPPIDAELLRRCAAGDPSARAVVAERALTLSLRTALAVVAGRDEAQDIAQDSAIDALRDIAQLRDPAAFDAWVHRLAARRAIRHARRRRVREVAELPLSRLTEPEQPGRLDVDVVGERALLVPALARLPARQRTAMALRYVHDLSDAEIAAALGCRVGTVHALLSRARSALRADPTLGPLHHAQNGGATR